MRRLLRIWKRLSIMNASTVFSNRLDAITFLLGKILRFLFFLALVFALFRNNQTFLGYDKYEFLLVFLTFNVVDLSAQILFRGVYFFPEQVLKGNFDFALSKPIGPLFWVLARLDPLDSIFVVPIIVMTVVVMFHVSGITILSLILYLLYLLIGVSISTSFHILSAAFTIHSPDSNGFIWFYREVFGMSRFPEETFSGALRLFFTFIIPAFIIASYPVKILLGRLSLPLALLAVAYAIIFLGATYLLWLWSLKKYSSASS
jgi:ABC-2 type transport system permease protein